MMRMPRVAIFTDSYHEANGVARTSKAIEACAKRRGMSLLSVRAGEETQLVHDGSITHLDLRRSRTASFRLENDLRFDLAMWRYISRVRAILHWFAPDVLHFTGPSDVGQLGAYLGHRLGIPMVASWHTNLHQYASRRTGLKSVEQPALRALMQFYRIPRVILAPNDELRSLLERETGKPTVLMPRGVDTELFTPARRRFPNWMVNIGYVGRLSSEKNVRALRAIEEQLDAEGFDVRFTIVGDGGERGWLEKHMQRADFMGVLRGGELATAYAEMDIFAFPSETDTVGNVVLEAMASGVPVVAMDRGGPKFLVENGRTGLVASDQQTFVDAVRDLVKNRGKREALGVAARSRALQQSSWDRIFHDICQAYGLAISLASRKGPAVGAPPVALAGHRQTA
ncbi:MAG: glycosyltransferase [Vicinamibacterales bacterium]|nr:glycosyltransferase [Vicinamibacterales bacterium]